jgi:hypothetical protein
MVSPALLLEHPGTRGSRMLMERLFSSGIMKMGPWRVERNGSDQFSFMNEERKEDGSNEV